MTVAIFRTGFAAAFVMAAFGSWITETNFLRHPRQPVADMTIPHQTKGVTVYISAQQRTLAFSLLGVQAIAAASLLITVARTWAPLKGGPNSN